MKVFLLMLLVLPFLGGGGGGSGRGGGNDGGFQSGRRQGRRQKGNIPMNNQNQNAQFNSVVKELGLNKAQARRLHDEITGQGYGRSEILEIAKEMFNFN